MYSRVMKPVDSVRAQPHLPGTLSRELLEVLPIGYQSSTHWSDVSCLHVKECSVAIFRQLCDCKLTTGKYWNRVHAVCHVARDGGSMPGISVITVQGYW